MLISMLCQARMQCTPMLVRRVCIAQATKRAANQATTRPGIESLIKVPRRSFFNVTANSQPIATAGTHCSAVENSRMPLQAFSSHHVSTVTRGGSATIASSHFEYRVKKSDASDRSRESLTAANNNNNTSVSDSQRSMSSKSDSATAAAASSSASPPTKGASPRIVESSSEFEAEPLFASELQQSPDRTEFKGKTNKSKSAKAAKADKSSDKTVVATASVSATKTEIAPKSAAIQAAAALGVGPAKAPTLDAKIDSAAKKHVKADVFLTAAKNTDSFEIKNSQLIFANVWQHLSEKHGGEENMAFPKDIMWLAGAPGAGKGAMTPLIMEYRGITAPPLEVGSLLTSPDAQRMKDSGQLVGDRLVIELLFDALLKPQYATGVLVDGFPRTAMQAECMKLLYDRMQLLRQKYAETPLHYKFRRPIFHITVLYIDKELSVQRQLQRGKQIQAHNAVVDATGIGQFKAVRETDISRQLAEERYNIFKTQIYEGLAVVKNAFHFHFLNAEGPLADVQHRLIEELAYQSSMELADVTFEQVRRIPLASECIQHARNELVRRLDSYQSRHEPLFTRVIDMLKEEVVHIIRRQALSGRAIVRSQNPILQEPLAVDMALDLLTERGFTVVLDVQRIQKPVRFDLTTGEIISSETRVYDFQIEFPRPQIRRG